MKESKENTDVIENPDKYINSLPNFIKFLEWMKTIILFMKYDTVLN